MASRGDVFSTGITTIANNGYLSVSTGSNEVVIHNVYHPGSVILYRYNGTTRIAVSGTITGVGIVAGLQIHCTSTTYLQIQNVSGDNQAIEVDGMNTK